MLNSGLGMGVLYPIGAAISLRLRQEIVFIRMVAAAHDGCHALFVHPFT
jgi:hypothetical protein